MFLFLHIKSPNKKYPQKPNHFILFQRSCPMKLQEEVTWLCCRIPVLSFKIFLDMNRKEIWCLNLKRKWCVAQDICKICTCYLHIITFLVWPDLTGFLLFGLKFSVINVEDLSSLHWNQLIRIQTKLFCPNTKLHLHKPSTFSVIHTLFPNSPLKLKPFKSYGIRIQ